MAKFTKPDMTYAWAISGDLTNPLPAKIQTGWVVEKPPHEYANWVENRQDNFLQYINQLGIPEWDSSTGYIVNQSYVQSSTTGIVYRAVQSNSNRNPDADTTNTYWVPAWDVYGSAQSVQTALTTLQANYNVLAALTNVIQARSNLGVYSTSQVDSAIASSAVPTGSIIAFGGTTAPTGYLLCNGSAYSRSGYANLFNIIGVAYGGGDGVSTFNVPDLRGQFVRGNDNSRGIDGGRVLGSSQTDTLQNITGSFTFVPGNYNGVGAAGAFYNTGSQAAAGSGAITTVPAFAFDASRVARTSTETRPVNVSANFIIKI